MIRIVLHRSLSWVFACSGGMRWERGDISDGWQDKSPDLRLGHVVGWIECFAPWGGIVCWRLNRKVQRIQRIKRHRLSFCGYRSP